MSQFATQTDPTANDTIVSLAPAYGDMLPDDIQDYLDTGTGYSLQTMPLVLEREAGFLLKSDDTMTAIEGRLESVPSCATMQNAECLASNTTLPETQLSLSMDPMWFMQNTLNGSTSQISPSVPYGMPIQNPCDLYHHVGFAKDHTMEPYGFPLQIADVHQHGYSREHFEAIDTLGIMPSSQSAYPQLSQWHISGYAPIEQRSPIAWQPSRSTSKIEVPELSSLSHARHEPQHSSLKRSGRSDSDTDGVSKKVSRRKIVPESSTARTNRVSPTVPRAADPLLMPDVKLDTRQEALTDVAAQTRVTQRSVCFVLESLHAGMTVTDDNGNDIKLSEVEYAENGRLLRVKIPLSNLYFCTNPKCDKMAEIPDKFSKIQPVIQGFGHDSNCRTASALSGAGKSWEWVHGVCMSCHNPHLARPMKKNNHCCHRTKRAAIAVADSSQLQKCFPNWITVTSSQDTGILACSVGSCSETREDVLYQGNRSRQTAKSSSLLPFFAHSVDCFQAHLGGGGLAATIARWCESSRGGHLVCARDMKRDGTSCNACLRSRLAVRCTNA